jgi:hypothetical protein
MLCGLPLALSVMVSEPVRLPLVEGTNVTLRLQLAAGATVLPQVLDCEKSPVIATFVILSGPSPVLLNVTLCEALVVATCCAGKASADVERATIGNTPFPDRMIDWGLPASLVMS